MPVDTAITAGNLVGQFDGGEGEDEARILSALHLSETASDQRAQPRHLGQGVMQVSVCICA